MTRFVLCVSNENFPVSLETRKLYETLGDATASRHGDILGGDESGEDYLYPASLFHPLTLPPEIEAVLVPR
jgi:hypothetical protein